VWNPSLATGISKLSQISWFGVDLFFVLSGFLITGVLLDSRGKSGYLKNFIARRTLRIFPAYFLFLGICFLAVPALLGFFGTQDGALEAAKGDIWWYLLYASNYLWIQNDPAIMGLMGIGTANALGPTVEYLGLTWSLAVEEQFYLLWPFVVLAFGRKLNRPIFVVVCSAILLRLFLLLSVENWSAGAYMSSVCRADSLVIGAAMAYYARSTRFRAVNWNRFANLGLYVFLPLSVMYQAFVQGPGDPLFTVVGYTVTALGFAGLLAAVVRNRSSWLKLVMETRILAWFGKYSYGIYLFHMLVWFLSHKVLNAELAPDGTPLDPAAFNPLFSNILLDAPIRLALVTGLTALLAWVSYHYFEKRFLRLKRYFT
jgi:peptidoglycan/LPS O-acetylase OafA/YrhL